MALSLRTLHARQAHKQSSKPVCFEVWLDESRAVVALVYPAGSQPEDEPYLNIRCSEKLWASVANLKANPLLRAIRWHRRDQAQTVADMIACIIERDSFGITRRIQRYQPIVKEVRP